MQPIRLSVKTGTRPYTVTIGENVASNLASILTDAGVGSQRIVVSSPTVWKLHGLTVADALPGAKAILVPDGERHKHLLTVQRIYDGLIKAGVDRAAAIVAVGGGVIGDVAGFAAATYLRGITLAHVPTTLLAQVDSAIGGKVGVNHALGKNLIGAVYPPVTVVVDPSFLATLPRREFRAGLYEVVKYGMIASPALFHRIANELPAIFARDPSVLTPVIAESCRIKGRVVEEDERESGPRRILNFGHTAGHALEAVTRYRRFRHGEAVAYGMLVAAEIATAREALPGPDRDALARLIMQMGPLPPIADLSLSLTLDAMARDKKVVAGTLHFVLPTAIGRTAIVTDVGEEEIARALKKVGMRG
jgi:3-dehydroquinate synthase